MVTITDARLAEIQDRCDAATEGPWHQATAQALAGRAVIRQSRPPAPSDQEAPDVLRLIPVEFPSNLMHDADFIAHARADLPDLLAYVALLKDQISRLERHLTALKAKLEAD